MSSAAVRKLQQQISQKRNELHKVVNGDVKLLLDENTYFISTQLDELIVKLMKLEMKEQKKKYCN